MPRSFEQNWAETFGYAAEHSPFSAAALPDAFQARARTAPLIRHVSREEIETLQMHAFVDLR